ncbi:MAG: acetolactate synthase [Candidatus Magasanikbacteria bacterium CG_4_9_14_0_2_um_filter_42_11]|uniref:Acetolactate synthase n=1 Tax=Candidatus Magasanikbacteria bacterium CG_4_9_14_0_2_um_filter_42_11 TaxID=1974643 RepID=A0A2M8F990_9BACT|nr:MAG: acetolactate synthase [Candidatus Magasanikbacteria bacterium CG_4_10_14_0_8_um_filter_42_12]PJC52314.1 MAG: acetolactate synthase [Candidatus Magasanikbacteria bacterium CG_4_9_14_0_2_um_filter_42_11]
MNVADYIIQFFAEKGVEEVFLVTGGQAMFLNDAVYREKRMKVTCTHHEQTVAMSADAYGRVAGKPAIAMVTAGPGAVNAMNGVVGGYTDSSPMIVISGQCDLSHVQYQQESGIRQYGVQGINIGPLVKSVTKYFVTVDEPAKILFYLQKSYHLATTGRPGPVWLDVPIDIQRSVVPDGPLEEFTPDEHPDTKLLVQQIKDVIADLRQAKRPLLLLGQGIRLSDSIQECLTVINKLGVPVLTSRLGIDILETNHPLYVGRPGTYGVRAGNFATQNADVMLVIGCRLATSLVGHNQKDFGRNAKKIVVDIDQKELDKPGTEIHVKIHQDAKDFLQEMIRQLQTETSIDIPEEWVSLCRSWKDKYSAVLPEYKTEKPVNSYYFTERLSELTNAKDMVMVDTGSCFHVAAQAWKLKQGQRYLTTGGLSSMGYWAAVIGACTANDRKRTICITGDGSLQMNIQEFATIKHYRLPVKIFIFNNNGYLLIKHTQKNYMEGRFIGTDPESGLWCPDSVKVADAYGLKAVRIDSVESMDEKIQEVLDYDGPVVCDVMTPEYQLLVPRTSSQKLPDGKFVSKPFEDMFPFLDSNEVEKNMVAEQEKKEKGDEQDMQPYN